MCISMKYLAKNILFLRKRKGLKQSEMYDELRVYRTTWNNYESGVSVPVLKDALRIANYFDVNLEDLLTKDLSEKGNLNEKSEDEKKQEKGKVKSNPIGNPITENEVNSGPHTKIEIEDNQPLKQAKTGFKSVETQLHDLSSKLANIEANMSKRIAQIEDKLTALDKDLAKK